MKEAIDSDNIVQGISEPFTIRKNSFPTNKFMLLLHQEMLLDQETSKGEDEDVVNPFQAQFDHIMGFLGKGFQDI